MSENEKKFRGFTTFLDGNDVVCVKGKEYTGCWIFGNTKFVNDEFYIASEADDNYSFKIIPETLCQLTGFVDKRGNKIYKEDVVQKGNDRYTVKWNMEKSAFYLYSENGILNFKATQEDLDLFDVVGTDFKK